MLVVTDNADFGEHWKLHVELCAAEFCNFSIGAGLLSTKVVGRKTKYGKTFVFVSLVQAFESFVLWGEAAL